MSVLVETSLGDLADYVNGRGFKSAEWGKKGLPIVRIANLNNPAAPYDFYDGPIDAGHHITTGDILVSWSATLDAFLWDRGDAALNQHIFKVLPRDSLVVPEYLFYVLKVAMVGLTERVHGATMKHVTRPEFESYRVRIHQDLNEQRRVAAHLKALQTELETVRKAAQTRVQDITLLRSRLLKDVYATLDSTPRKVLGDHAPTTSGSTPSRGNKRYWEPAEIPWVKTGEVAFAPVTQTQEAVSKLALAECSLTLLPPKSVLVAMIGQGKTRGQSALLEIAATTNQNCFAVLPNDTWEPEFLYYWFVANYQNLRSLSADRGGSQSALNGALLNALEVPAPDQTLQLEVVHHVKSALHELDTLAASCKTTMDEFELLPQRLLAQAFEN